MTRVLTTATLLTALVCAGPVLAQTEHNHDHQAGAPKAAAAAPVTDEAYIALMVAGLRPDMGKAAGVIRWKKDFTWETVKAGTSNLVCFDRSDEDRRNPYAVQCTSVANLPRVAQNRRFRAESKTNEEEQAKVAAAEKNGTRVKPEYGSPWININGPDSKTLRTHTTIAVPGATGASLGLPEDNKKSGAWVMDGGTSAAHIMLPGQ